jgi:hypothetical protein
LKPKYKRVYHYLAAKWAIQDLERRRLKLSVFGQVDDEDELHNYILSGFEGITRELIEDFTNRFQFICFAPNPEHSCMWKRYGDEGRGICLSLQVVAKDTDLVEYVADWKVGNFPPHIHEILRSPDRYRKARKSSAFLKACRPYVEPFILTKQLKWSYEREIRMIPKRNEQDGGLYFASFRGNSIHLKEVILGLNCAVEEDEIRKLTAEFPQQPIAVSRANTSSCIDPLCPNCGERSQDSGTALTAGSQPP